MGLVKGIPIWIEHNETNEQNMPIALENVISRNVSESDRYSSLKVRKYNYHITETPRTYH